MHCFHHRKYKSFWFLPVFCWNDFLEMFLHDPLNVGVRQIIPRLILHKILDVYSYINSMNLGPSIFQKLFVQ